MVTSIAYSHSRLSLSPLQNCAGPSTQRHDNNQEPRRTRLPKNTGINTRFIFIDKRGVCTGRRSASAWKKGVCTGPRHLYQQFARLSNLLVVVRSGYVHVCGWAGASGIMNNVWTPRQNKPRHSGSGFTSSPRRRCVPRQSWRPTANGECAVSTRGGGGGAG